MQSRRSQIVNRMDIGPRVTAFGRWYLTLILLMAENFGLRFKRSRMAVILAIVEPMGIIGLLSLVHSLIAKKAPFGTSFMLFYGTGVLPYYLLFHVSLRVRSMDMLKRMPRTTEFDVLLSHVMDEFVLKLIVMILCFGSLWLLGVPDAAPVHPAQCFGAMAIFAAFGVGLGMINAVISSFLFVWSYVYSLLARAMLMFSGVLYVLDTMPKDLRDFAVYVPFAHGVALFRSGYYGNYPALLLDVRYLLLWTIGILCFGWLLKHATREWRPTA